MSELSKADTANPSGDGDAWQLPEFCTVEAVGVGVVGGQLLVVVLVLAGGGWDWVRLAVMSFYVQWVVLISLGLLCFARTLLNRLPWVLAASACFAIVVTVTATTGTAVSLLVNEGVVRGSQVASEAAIAAIVAGVLLRYFHIQQHLRRREQTVLRSRIQALQARIRPHFLFNSMNSIASLIPVNPEEAENAVEDLSELFRASLSDVRADVPLAEELELCRRYLRIESLRLGERLQVVWELEEQPHHARLPMLTLQPLVENAVYHGIQPRPEGGQVRIRVGMEGRHLVVWISNPMVDGSDQRSVSSGNHMAISNIRQRLAALYGDQASLSILNDGEQWQACVRIPMDESQ